MDGQTDGRREGAGADSSPPPTEKHFTFVDTASVESRRPRLAARRHPLSHSFLKNPETLQPFLFKLLFFFVLYRLVFSKAGTNWTRSAAHTSGKQRLSIPLGIRSVAQILRPRSKTNSMFSLPLAPIRCRRPPD